MSNFLFTLIKRVFLCLFFAHTANSLDVVITKKRIYGENFSNQKLMKADFSHHDFRDVNFDNVDLTDADFSNSTFENVTFKNSKLVGANFDGTDFYESEFNNSTFFQVTLNRKPVTAFSNRGPVTAKVNKFHKTKMEYVEFDACDLSGANFSEANLKHVYFKKSNVNSTNFNKAVLKNISFSDATTVSTLFKGAKLFFPIFGQSLSGADFRKAKLVGADFSKVDLNKANFSKAALSDVCFPNITTTLTRISKAKVYNNCSNIPQGVESLSINLSRDPDLIERSVSPYEEYNTPPQELDD